jgi:hypothetical protein
METAKAAKPIDGNLLYQKQARQALPLLVQQAQAGTPMSYTELATAIGMPNPRNLNWVLASVGKTIKLLAKKWQDNIPPITCLVINKGKSIPGDGVGGFIRSNFSQLPLPKKRQLVNEALGQVYAFPRWQDVLQELGLRPSGAWQRDELIDNDDEAEFPEGRILYRRHRQRERNALLVKRAKARALKRDGKLACAACGFEFRTVYGLVGRDFIEAHHTRPLAELTDERPARIEEIALVCSNCHRMIHRKRPWLRMNDLAKLIKDHAKR